MKSKKKTDTNLVQLPSGSWRVQKMYEGKYIRFTVKEKPSKRELDAMIQERANGLKDTGKYLSFENAYNNYVKAKSNILSPSTLRGYDSLFRNIPEQIKKTSIYNFDSDYIQKFVNDYSLEHSAKSVKNMYGLIAIVLKYSRKEIYLKVTLPKKEKIKAYTPSNDDIKRILEESKGSEYEIPLRLASYGLRKGEIVALDISDLSEENRLSITKDLVQDKSNKWILKPTPKTEASNRSIFIDEYTAELIRTKGCIYKGFPNNINRALGRYQNKLGIPHFNLHKMRHYFASISHEMGISDADIMKMGGWETDEIMKTVYREAMEKSLSEGERKYANMILGL